MVVLRAVSILARTRPFVVVRAAPAVLPRVHLTPVPARTLTTSVSVQGKNRSNEPSAKQKRRGKGEPDLSELDHDEAGDVPVIDKKTGEIKGQVGDDKRNGEKFDEDQTKIRFKKVLDAAESHLSELMVRVKRPDPSMLLIMPPEDILGGSIGSKEGTGRKRADFCLIQKSSRNFLHSCTTIRMILRTRSRSWLVLVSMATAT